MAPMKAQHCYDENRHGKQGLTLKCEQGGKVGWVRFGLRGPIHRHSGLPTGITTATRDNREKEKTDEESFEPH